MGACLSARIKAESPGNTAANPKYVSTDGNEGSSTGSKVSADSVSPATYGENEILYSPNLNIFSFTELKTATRNFRTDSMIGEGGFGSVFKGWIDENSLTAAKPGTGTKVAVKRLKPESFQGHREWLAEVNTLGQLDHPNLVKLIGYCLEDEHRLLVYEFMPRGSLENHLFRSEYEPHYILAINTYCYVICAYVFPNLNMQNMCISGGSYFQPLSWALRLKVAHDAAKGLAFLHNAERKVIYRDFKTSNILLDSNYNAKLSDFGLAKDGPTGDKSHVSTRIMGTYGYAAPEYMVTGHLTTRSDVYSFGVVLLEMLSGRSAIDKNRPSAEKNLVEWAKPYMANKRKINRVMDNRLEGQYSVDAARRTTNLALRCLSADAKLRPKMDEVVLELEQIQLSQEAGRPENNLSTNRRPMHHRRRNADNADGGRRSVNAYPRPSASLR